MTNAKDTAQATVSRRALLIGTTLSALAAPFDARAEEKAAEKKAKKVTPLTKEQRQILRDIPVDPPPANLIQDQHFVVSDEHFPERFRTAMADLGGVYIGVGPEQNYLFAGWSKPDILILLDFDQMVVDLHELYRVFILHADGPEAFVKLWSKPERAAAVAAIKQAVTDEDAQKNLLSVFQFTARPVHNRLKSLRIRYDAMSLATFLTDPSQYDYLKELHKAGRVRAVRGDLTKDKAMKGVAKAAKQLGVPVRCVYLSNVEQYFDYANGLGDNCKAQPTDAASKILRTVYKGESKYERYHYCVQRDDHFRAWLATDVKNLRAMMEKAYKRIKKTKETWILPGPA